MINFLIKEILKKNHKLRDKYKDQECYILGNGASIKNYNLNVLKDKNVIICNWMSLHKDIINLKNIIAYIECTPFWFFPYFRNPYTKKLRPSFHKKLFLENYSKLNCPLFPSVSNFFFLNKSTTFFLHDFGNKDLNFKNFDICNKFSLLGGASYTMLAIAKYMGFKKINLIGLDYWMTEPIFGHFYEKTLKKNEKNINSIKDIKHNNDRFFLNQVTSEIDTLMICPNGFKSELVKSVNYSDFFQMKEEKNENNEIVSLKNLEALSKCGWQYDLF